MTRIAVVIRCHNEEAHIGRLLTGLMRQSRRPDEIVVVDSGSTDATLAIASAFPVEIHTIAPEDFSFGRALNLGLRATTAEVAVIASAHVYPLYETWIELLTAPFEDESIALTYGRQQAPESGRFSEHQLLARWFPTRSVARQRDPFCNNANAAIRRALWEHLPYDEDLTGLEDVAWAKSALSLGYFLSYVAEAPVVHVHHESFSQVVNRYRREAISHKRLYHEQRMSVVSALGLAAANIVGDLREAGRRGILREHAVEIAKFRTAQFAGTYQGFRQTGPVPQLLRQRFYYPPEAEHSEPPAGDDVGAAIDYESPLPPE
jgi:rhamnosyltransferase